MITPLQYITQDHPELSHADLCREACQAGVKWVQLRMKDVPHYQYLHEALNCRIITKAHGAMLIINDNLEIAIKSGADGVHLGQNDMPVAEARKLVDEDFIIGGTANTFEQVEKHVADGADYVGVGPFRFTSTKKNLSPILDLEGYSKIVSEMNCNNLDIPLIAIGGIETAVVSPLLDAGVSGIAVSSLLTKAYDRGETVREILDCFKVGV